MLYLAVFIYQVNAFNQNISTSGLLNNNDIEPLNINTELLNNYKISSFDYSINNILNGLLMIIYSINNILNGLLKIEMFLIGSISFMICLAKRDILDIDPFIRISVSFIHFTILYVFSIKPLLELVFHLFV